MIYVILVLSIIFNAFSIWYVRNLLKDLHFFSSEFSTLDYNLNVFKKHLEELKKLTTFSDDPVIKGLYEHVDDLTEYMESFQELYNTEESGEYFDEEEEDSPQ